MLILRQYPQICPPSEWPNLVLDARGTDAVYSERAGPLSIKCVFRGREIHEVRGARFAVDRDCYLILNQGQRYSSYCDPASDVEAFSIFFAPGFAECVLHSLTTEDHRLLEVQSADQAVAFFEKLYPHDDIVTPVVREIRAAVQRRSADSVWLEERFHTLLERLLVVHRSIRMEIEKLPAIRHSTRMELYRRLHRARDYMASSFDEPITLARVADVACLSPHHFLREFKRTFRETPHQYLSALRLKRAQELLLESDRSVTEVCFAVGFESPGSFSSLFRRHVGCSPRQFRQEKSHFREESLRR